MDVQTPPEDFGGLGLLGPVFRELKRPLACPAAKDGQVREQESLALGWGIP